MMDLQKDLEKWITDYDIGKRGEWLYMIGEYIKRAIKAEAEVERLQKVYAITNESWKKQVEENAQLRKVADAAKIVDENIYLNHCGDYVADNQYMRLLEEPLSAYMAWKEGQE